jgi:hypothetical protein
MTSDQALTALLDALEEAGVAYMIVGSWASGVHGEARATHDTDVVVQVAQGKFARFVGLLRGGFYLPARAWDALASGRGTNVIHVETALKVDLIPVRDREFSQLEFSRRVAVQLLGKPRSFASPEDTLLSKLEWAKRGGGERHIEDAIGVARVQGPALDWHYVCRWGRVLGVDELVGRVKSAAREA